MSGEVKFQFVLSDEIKRQNQHIANVNQVFRVSEVDFADDLYRVSWGEGNDHYNYLKKLVNHFIEKGDWKVLH